MTSHARGPSDAVSVAKLGLYGTIATAIIAGGAHIINGRIDHPEVSAVPKGPTPTILTSINEPQSGGGLSVGPMKNGKLPVSGSAQKDVKGMWVVIGPKPSGQYDAVCANVVNQQWQAAVATDPSWQKYPLVTVPYYGSCGGATSASALKFTFQGTEPTTPPPPPPDQIANCAVQFGPSCFNGPGFGPPSVYQQKQ